MESMEILKLVGDAPVNIYNQFHIKYVSNLYRKIEDYARKNGYNGHKKGLFYVDPNTMEIIID
jgi:hypothetical protein